MKAIRKAYKFRIYPTKAQTTTLRQHLGICRELYNSALQERNEAYDRFKKFEERPDVCARFKKSISFKAQCEQLPKIKLSRPDVAMVYSQTLQDVLHRIDKAFDNFFRRVKNGETPGYPQYKSANRYNSITYPQLGWSLKNDRLTLAKIGTIKVKLHREVIGKVKTVNLKREGVNWFAVFSVETTVEVPEFHEGGSIGIDVGLHHFANLTTGEQIDNPRYFRKSQKRLAKAQRKLDKLKSLPKFNPTKRKARKAVAKTHRKIANQRADFQHKLSLNLVQTYSLIAVEDLRVMNMMRKPKPKPDPDNPGAFLPNGKAAKGGLNKSISDAAWGTFVNMLGYKAEKAGSWLLKVYPAYSSQTCPECGVIVKKELANRWHSCECGCEMHRDTAAAMIILGRGLASIGSQSLEATRL